MQHIPEVGWSRGNSGGILHSGAMRCKRVSRQCSINIPLLHKHVPFVAKLASMALDQFR